MTYGQRMMKRAAQELAEAAQAERPASELLDLFETCVLAAAHLRAELTPPGLTVDTDTNTARWGSPHETIESNVTPPGMPGDI